MSASERRIAELEAELEAQRTKTAELRHLLKSQMRAGESLEFEAIVNSDGRPLVNFRWDQLMAQMPAGDAREVALSLLRVCEWATVDAEILKAALKAFDGDENVAGGLMAILREARGVDEEHSA